MAFNWGAAASIAQAGTGIGAPILSAVVSSKQNRDQRQFLLDRYNQERADSLSDWYRENEYGEYVWNKMNQYNSPSAQMARYKEAGLNPALIYGQSNVAPAIATANFNTPKTGSYNPQRIDVSGIANAFNRGLDQYIAYRDSAVRSDNVRAQTDVLRQQKMNAAMQGAGIALDNQKKAEEMPYVKDRANASLRMSLQALENSVQQFQLNEMRNRREEASNSLYLREGDMRLKGMQSDNTRKELELNLIRAGINPSDPTIIRMLGQFFDKDIKNILRYLKR